MSYGTIFPGAVSKPAAAARNAISLAVSTALMWPTQTASAGLFVASTLDVTPTVGGLMLRMPDARSGVLGPVSIVTNLGAVGFTLSATDGTGIVAATAGQSYWITLIGNSTAPGIWRSLGLGSLANSVTAGQVADNETIQAGPSGLQLIELTNALGSSATLVAASRGSLNILSAGSGAALWVLDLSANLTVGWWCEIANQSGSAITLVGTAGETINGYLTFTVNPSTSLRVVCKAGGFVVSLASLLIANALIYGGASVATTPAARIASGQSGQVLTSNVTSGAPSATPSFQNPAAYVQPAQENLVINGGCRVGARARAGITIPASNAAQYGQVDLMKIYCATAGSVTTGSLIQQSGNSFGSTGYSATLAGLTTTNNDATVTFTYRIESVDAVTAAPSNPGYTVTVQAVVRQNTGLVQNYQIALSYPTNGTDDYSTGTTLFGRSSAIQVVSGVATTISWTTSVLFSSGGLGAVRGIEIDVTCNCGAVTAKNFDLTDLGLFISHQVVLPFPAIPYQQELSRCERYLPRYFWNTASQSSFVGYATSSTAFRLYLVFRGPARVIPIGGWLCSAANTFAIYDVASGTSIDCQGQPGTSGQGNAAYMQVIANVAAGLTAGKVGFLGSGSGGGTFTQAYILVIGAEL